MPNLEHDPQNPTDLLDRPIAPGDIVAWGTTYGKSAALCIARIVRIRFIKTSCRETNYTNVEVDQIHADDYQLVLEPLKSTGRVTWIDSQDPTRSSWSIRDEEVKRNPSRYGTKKKTIQHVKNVCLLEPMV